VSSRYSGFSPSSVNSAATTILAKFAISGEPPASLSIPWATSVLYGALKTLLLRRRPPALLHCLGRRHRHPQPPPRSRCVRVVSSRFPNHAPWTRRAFLVLVPYPLVQLIASPTVSDLAAVTALRAVTAVSARTRAASAWAGQATLAGGPRKRRLTSSGKRPITVQAFFRILNSVSIKKFQEITLRF
jgi:hypothetical protein